MDIIETNAGKREELHSVSCNLTNMAGSSEAKAGSITGFIKDTVLGFLFAVLIIELLILLGTAAFIYLVGPAIGSFLDYVRLIEYKILLLLMRGAGGAGGA